MGGKNHDGLFLRNEQLESLFVQVQKQNRHLNATKEIIPKCFYFHKSELTISIL